MSREGIVAATRPEPAPAQPLPAESLYRAADLEGLRFATTAELEPLSGLLVQPRASEAIDLLKWISPRYIKVFWRGNQVRGRQF